MLGAEPMKLGLDLRGGVHFLMEVDMDTALSKLQEQTMDTLRSELREGHSLRVYPQAGQQRRGSSLPRQCGP